MKKIAETKMPDLNAASVESAMSMVAGTARSMGIEVVDEQTRSGWEEQPSIPILPLNLASREGPTGRINR